MKKKYISRLSLGVLTTLLFACNSKTAEVAPANAVNVDEIKAIIQGMESDIADSYNLRSAAGETYYAEDAISFAQNQPPIVGKAAIDKSMADNLSRLDKGDKISFTVVEVIPSSDGNQVVEIGAYKVVDSLLENKYKGNFMSVFVKRKGKYVCIRDMVASDMPKKEAK